MSRTPPTHTPINPSSNTLGAATSSPSPTRLGVVNHRAEYLAWGLAWLVGHGSFALSRGGQPLLSLPTLLPPLLLGAGMLTAAVITVRSSMRAQRELTRPAKDAHSLYGIAWLTTFAVLTLLITALDQVLNDALVSTLLWPAGSAIVVGLMYITGGVLQRDIVEYGLGTYLAVLGAAVVFLGSPGHYGALAVAGSAAYFLAAAQEGRRQPEAPR